MKKYGLAVVSVLVGAGALTACGDNATGEEIEQLLTDSNEAMGNLNSYAVETAVHSDDFENNASLQLTRDPVALTNEHRQPDAVSGETDVNTEFIEDGIYYYEEPSIGEWIKLDAEEAGITGAESLRPAEAQLDMMKQYSDQLELNDKGDDYILSASGTDGELKELALEMAGGQQAKEMGLEVTDFDIEIVIDKSSLLQKEATMTLGFQMPNQQENEEEADVQTQSLTSTYSQFNEVEDIHVPDEVTNEAIDIEEAQEMMEQQQAELEQEAQPNEDSEE
ncbi:hypothetical protein CAY60_012435 [Shouchella clausii]|uniref:Lipoprotein n=1 Tax=Shouchella clausii TaxID=79880 RepID=A0A268NXM2_SHOCL|nr:MULTISPECIES: DUF6612 family protein [Shouchella]ALA51916.1 hypothetical protein DB29_01088 [Shouchella clausii]MBU3232057.1 hypothetical protein [Shouchella clausii]MBU3264347.1 hypothetical protein [Shouchella clausii]MBU3508774.1 hypothetical protein [Shouchella clausii]MBU3535039.1 hypothetical protein [Shouchella clausii]